METRPRSRMTLGRWSVFVGAAQSKLVDLLIRNTVNVGLIIGLVCLLVAIAPGTPGFVLGVVGGSLSLLALLLTFWLLRREALRGTTLLNIFVGAKLLLLVAAGAGYHARRPDDPVWIWCAMGLALLGVLSEPTVKLLLTKAIPVATQLPGVRSVPDPPVSQTMIVMLPLGQVLGTGLLAILGAPGWVLFGLIVISMVPMLILIGHAVLANLICTRQAAGVRAALEKFQPQFAVYHGATVGARYQLGMWLPYLERLDLPFIVVSQHARNVPDIKAMTSAPILVPKPMGDRGTLADIVVPSLKAAFYVQGSSSNLNFQRFRQLTHIWLNHGDSDKRANFTPAHATFDKVFVAGQQGVERYAAHGVRIPASKMVVVGRPQIERIQPREHPPAPDAPRTILYAPTWQGGKPTTNYSSLGLGAKIVAALLERGATVIFRPHPFSYRDPGQARLARHIQQLLKQDKDRTGRSHVWGDQAEKAWDIPDCFNRSDALVTDVSSVASDFLASGKPFAMVAIQQRGQAFLKEIPMARVAYVIEKDLSTLTYAVDALFGPDPLAEQRLKYRIHCLGEQVGEHAADGFLAAAHKIIA
ncbi:MAG TPA: CDP-glycerol glycerophosphotransferase family protein, partial [Propionibacteriaceae bacterium]|nr:CDP-glycerol glycerophosphotransferase family protein [Propionibacteriaceae bacterium]